MVRSGGPSAPCWVRRGTIAVCSQVLERRRRYGKMGDIFFQLLHSDPFAKHWYYDDEGFESCTLRYPIVESFRKWEG